MCACSKQWAIIKFRYDLPDIDKEFKKNNELKEKYAKFVQRAENFL